MLSAFCILLACVAEDQTQGMLKAHWTTELQLQHPITEQSRLKGPRILASEGFQWVWRGYFLRV